MAGQRLQQLVILLLAPMAFVQAQDFQHELNQLIQLTQQRQLIEAIQHGHRAVALDPRSWLAPFSLARAQAAAHNLPAAEASISQAIVNYEAGSPPQELRYHFVIYAQRAGFRKWLGEIQPGLADLERSLQIAPGNPAALDMKAQFQMLTGDAPAAVATLREALANHRPEHQAALRKVRIMLNLGQALRLSGKDREALAVFDQALAENDPERGLAYAGAARVLLLTSDPTLRDLARARSLIVEADRLGLLMRLESANALAILHYLEGTYEEALELFRLSEYAVDDTEGTYYHGLTRLRLGDSNGAVRFLALAASLDPSYARRIANDPLTSTLAAAVNARLTDLIAKQTVAERVMVRVEQNARVTDLSQINDFVRAFKFDIARRDLESLAKQVKVESIQAEIKERLARVLSYQRLFEQLIAAINTGKLKGATIALPNLQQEVQLARATPQGLELAIARGTTQATWNGLAFADRFELLARLPLTAKEWWTLSLLAEDSDASRLVERSLAQVHRLDSKQHEAISQRIARLRNSELPTGGYVLFRGSFVSANEKTQLEKGLVLFRGEWVTPADRDHIAKNHVKVDGRWIPLTAEQLRARGLVEYEGRWLAPAELAQVRGEWSHAWQHETEHYRIRSNVSERFAQRLGVALETAHLAYEAFFGASWKGSGKADVLAMASYEDYRNYCQTNNALNLVNAGGFAMPHKRTVIGYDKQKSEDALMRTMLHEGAHLFYGLAFSGQAPSWLDEGMATYFEGFTLDNHGKPTFDHISTGRLGQLKLALNSAQLFSMDELLNSDALQLINSDANRASVFYAQCWGLFYFFNTTIDSRFKTAFTQYFDGIKRGARPDLKKLLGGSYGEVETAFKQFIHKQ
jgi:hypothetical protein